MGGRTQKKTFSLGADASDNLANERHQFIEFYHVPTGLSVRFKAFLTEFDDGFESDWNDEEAFGRMDPISTFKRTSRKINLGFDVPAGSAEEAIENQEKVSLLKKMLYPTYESAQGGASTINASPLFKLKFMNLIENTNAGPGGSDAKTGGLLGKVSGFNHAPDIDAGFFDVLFAGTPALFPQQYNISFEYTVLHQHKLGWSPKGKNFPERGVGFARFPYGVSLGSSETPGRSGGGTNTTSGDRKKKSASIKMLKSQGNR